MILYNSSSPLHQHSANLENILWTETEYAVLSTATHGYVVYVYLRFDLTENSASGMQLTQQIVRSLRPVDIL